MTKLNSSVTEPIKNSYKKVILVISFGTSYNHTRKITIDVIEKEIQSAYPDYEIRKAFTSQVIIDKLNQRDGLKIDNIKEAMDKLVLEGIETVICQPTHIMHGYEYDKIIKSIKPYKNKIKNIHIGRPLLSSSKDYEKVVNAIIKENIMIKKEDILLLIGHGTEHFADSSYAALDYRFKIMGYENIFLGTIEGYPDKDTVLNHLAKTYTASSKMVYLAPFMIVAGDHANNDIFGNQKNTWKTEIEKSGFPVHSIKKGLGEYPFIRKILIEHTQESILNSVKI